MRTPPDPRAFVRQYLRASMQAAVAEFERVLDDSRPGKPGPKPKTLTPEAAEAKRARDRESLQRRRKAAKLRAARAAAKAAKEAKAAARASARQGGAPAASKDAKPEEPAASDDEDEGDPAPGRSRAPSRPRSRALTEVERTALARLLDGRLLKWAASAAGVSEKLLRAAASGERVRVSNAERIGKWATTATLAFEEGRRRSAMQPRGLDLVAFEAPPAPVPPSHIRLRAGLSPTERAFAAEARTIVAQHERPRTRGDCLAGGVNEARPCVWAGCRFHLALTVGPRGTIEVHRGHLDLAAMPDTCSLDVADRGPMKTEDVGRALNVGFERARQIERWAKQRLARANARLREMLEDLPPSPRGPYDELL